MKTFNLLKGLKDPSSKYYCGSAALLNLFYLLKAENINNKKLQRLSLVLAEEDKDYFALSSKEELSFNEERKIKRITRHYIYIIEELKKIISTINNNLFINNYHILKDLLSYTISSLKLKKEVKIISKARKIVKE